MVCVGAGSGGRTGLEPPSSAVSLSLNCELPVGAASGSSNAGALVVDGVGIRGEVGSEIFTAWLTG